MNTYAKGARVQRKAAEILRLNGYAVEIAPFTRFRKDFFNSVDIIAVGKNVIFMQVKTNAPPGVMKNSLKKILAIPIPDSVHCAAWNWVEKNQWFECWAMVRGVAMQCSRYARRRGKWIFEVGVKNGASNAAEQKPVWDNAPEKVRGIPPAFCW